MNRKLILAASLVAVAFVALACNGGGDGEPVATHTPAASPTPDLFALPGFAIELAPETRTTVSIGHIPVVFEDHPDVVAAELSQTSEGQVSSPASICLNSMLVRNVVSRLLGTWLSHAIVGGDGACLATRQGFPREGPGLRSALALETATQSWAEAATVVAPSEPFQEDGVTYFPPEPMDVRGLDGIYLREEGTGTAYNLPVHQLIWIEDGIYWRLIGMDEEATGDPSYYSLDRLLRVAETLREAISN